MTIDICYVISAFLYVMHLSLMVPKVNHLRLPYWQDPDSFTLCLFLVHAI
jgi:hypothetical protein